MLVDLDGAVEVVATEASRVLEALLVESSSFDELPPDDRAGGDTLGVPA